MDFSTPINASKNLLALLLVASSVTPKRTYDTSVLPLEVREKLPPKAISSMPGLDWINREELRVFANMKDEANTLIESISVSYIGNIRCVEANDVLIDQLEEDLKEIQSRYRKKRDEVVANLPEKIRKHKEQYPLWANVIEDIAPTPGYIRDQVDFDWVWTPIAAAGSNLQGRVKDVVEARMKTHTENMVDKLYQDIAETADALLKRHRDNHGFAENARVNRRVLDPLGMRPSRAQSKLLDAPPITQKLRTLAFLHETTVPLADYIDQLVARLDRQDGPILGNDVVLLHGLLTTLSDRDKIKSLCEALSVSGVATMVDAACKEADGVVKPVKVHTVVVPRVDLFAGLHGNTVVAPKPAANPAQVVRVAIPR